MERINKICCFLETIIFCRLFTLYRNKNLPLENYFLSPWWNCNFQSAWFGSRWHIMPMILDSFLFFSMNPEAANTNSAINNRENFYLDPISVLHIFLQKFFPVSSSTCSSLCIYTCFMLTLLPFFLIIPTFLPLFQISSLTKSLLKSFKEKTDREVWRINTLLWL